VDALLRAAATPETDGRIYNLGGERPIRLIDLARLLIELNDGGEYCVRTFPPDCKRIDIGSYYADYRLFRSVTGWEPRVPLREGFARTLAYYRERLQEYV
jgi:UDP-glucose 4-epimerase